MQTHVDHNGEIKPGPFVRQPYNYSMDKVSDETGLKCEDESMAQQSFKDETDINTIVRRFGLTGELPKDLRVPSQGEYWEIQDFQSALNMVRAGEEAFMQMPADIRAQFDNDPGRFLDFVHDEDNRTKAEKMGILVPKPQEPKAQEETPKQ